ncbi:TIGR02391 family protein [Hymenobacter sp. CA1UV-4]|nr:TIGR02391 family protein [Hymenobacter sp. CA1UV-4]
MEFPFPICPLTGIPTLGNASTVPTGSQQVLYSFKPIGQAIFSLGQAIKLKLDVERKQLVPRPDLAGLCREAAENNQSPFLITGELFARPLYNTPDTFEEKQDHFLKFLYQKGGREHKRRDIFVYNDFPLAYTGSAKEFFELIESLLAEELISCIDPGADLNSWPFGIRGEYYSVLLTREGKQKAKELLEGPPPSSPAQPTTITPISLSTLHPAVQQAAGSRFASAHYADAISATCTALDKAVAAKAQRLDLNGKQLMDVAFTPKNPLVRLSPNDNEQTGFMLLYQGVMQAIRNHYAHNLTEVPAARALEWLGFISALFYKLDESTAPSDNITKDN